MGKEMLEDDSAKLNAKCAFVTGMIFPAIAAALILPFVFKDVSVTYKFIILAICSLLGGFFTRRQTLASSEKLQELENLSPLRKKSRILGGYLLLGVVCLFGISLMSYTSTAPRYTQQEAIHASRTPTQTNNGADDVAKIQAIADLAMSTGTFTSFDVSGFHRRLDLNASVATVGQAQTIANGICKTIRQEGISFTHAWTVRVFLPYGERPAAICELR